MTQSQTHDQIVTYGKSPAWLLQQTPVEVLAVATADPSVPPTANAAATLPAGPVPRSVPTRDQMMAAFRTLREQRRNAEESEIVVEDIVNADVPGSLMADVHSALKDLDA